MPDGIFLLDTNILSDAQRPLPNPILADWFRLQKRLAIPFPVILEIERGIAEVAEYNNLKAMKLRAWMDRLLATDYVFPSDSPAVARVLGAMYCCGPLKELWFVDEQSKKKPGQDLFIAAIAITYDFPIATLNVRDFERINRYFPLPGVYDPIAAVWAVPKAKKSQQFSAKPLSVSKRSLERHPLTSY